MSGSKSSIVSDDISASTSTPSVTEFTLYSSRWILLVSVTLLNLANYSHWVAFASVAKQGAEYYQVSGPEVKYSIDNPQNSSIIVRTGCSILNSKLCYTDK